MVFAFICLSIIGAVGIVAYDRINAIVADHNKSLSQKALHIVPVLTISLIITGVFFDGIFAIINWRWWLAGLCSILKYVF
jgi:hypothetical protein